MTAYTWSSLQNAVATAVVQQSHNAPADFILEFPAATSYAEGRVARDLVLLNTRAIGTGVTQTGANAQYFNMATLTAPGGLSQPMMTAEYVQVQANGVNYPFTKSSLEHVLAVWPQGSGLTVSPATTTERFWAPINDTNILIAPPTDQSYPIFVTGLYLMIPMSSANQLTYIGSVYGDLMFAATMVFMSEAVLMGVSVQIGQTPPAMNWERLYQGLLPGAKAEEARRRGLIPDVEQPPAAPGGQQAA